MGSGYWSTDTYTTRSLNRAATGTSAFAYNDDVLAKQSYEERSVHETLNPLDKDREARDNDDHPNSVPVAVMFDVTGSMGTIPRIMQESLPILVESLALKGLVEDGQIMFGAIGDAYSDRAPLQVGQFEADNRVEDHLGNIWLEGYGGGQNQESYELAMYYFARHVFTDSWEKRQKKGYLFITGDEQFYPKVNAKQVSRIIGDDLSEDIPTEKIVEELQEKWHVYFVVPKQIHGGRERWEDLLGKENVIDLTDVKELAELVAKTVGAAEEAEAAAKA